MLDYLRIATENAVAPPALLARYRKLLEAILSPLPSGSHGLNRR